MTAAVFQTREQALAGVLAGAMHVLLLVFLVFGVSWQHKQIDSAVVVDLWRDVPTAAAPKAEVAPPPPVPVAKPEPPAPVPKAEVKPPPPKPEPAVKPDIALKEKQEKERKLKEQVEAKKRADEKAREAQKAREAEKAREADAEKKKRAEAEALKKKQAADAEAKRIAGEQAKAQEAVAAQQAAAAKREVDKYLDGIRSKVKRFVLVPPSVQGNPEAEVVVTLLPGGEVLNVRIKKSSGNPAYDEAVERAVRRAQPFEVPAGDAFQRNFREFTMAFRPVN